jgi:hypothetical protein
VREIMAARQKADLAALVFQRDFLFLVEGKPVILPGLPEEPEATP